MLKYTVAIFILFATFVGNINSHPVEQDDISTRLLVVGGEIARDDQFPFYVKLNTKSGVICGGTIIDKHWVVTAAHCVQEWKDGKGNTLFKPGDYVITRVRKYTGNIPEMGDSVKTAVEIIPHPEYRAKQAHDVALIKVKEDLLQPTENGVKPEMATLPNPGDRFEEKDAIIMGTGGMETGISAELRYANVKTTNREKCTEASRSPGMKMICTVDDGKVGVRGGDSGSGLIVNDPRKGAIVVGTASFTIGGGEIQAMYQDLSAYRDFIKQHVGK